MTRRAMEDREQGLDIETDEPGLLLGVTRRQLFSTSSASALVFYLGPLAACAQPGTIGEPFDDGTFFDDGAGWVD